MKRLLKWLTIMVGGLLGLIILVLAGIWLVSASRLNRTYEVTANFSLDIPNDAGSIAEGKRFYAIMCAHCHGENLAGLQLSDDFLTFGRIYAANLTSGAGGLGQIYSDEDFARAIWYGVKPDGSPTVAMPVEFNRGIHQKDMENLIAYIRSVPPEDAAYPELSPGPLLRVMHVTNMFPLVTAEVADLNAAPPGVVAPEDILGHGEYLSVLCTGCHGPDFTGGNMGEPSLVPVLSNWSEAQFMHALRTGQRPDGTTLNDEEMPWPAFSNFTDDEIHAIWTYLQSIEAVASLKQ